MLGNILGCTGHSPKNYLAPTISRAKVEIKPRSSCIKTERVHPTSPHKPRGPLVWWPLLCWGQLLQPILGNSLSRQCKDVNHSPLSRGVLGQSFCLVLAPRIIVLPWVACLCFISWTPWTLELIRLSFLDWLPNCFGQTCGFPLRRAWVFHFGF